MTKVIEGQKATIDSVISTICFLLEILEQKTGKFYHDIYMSLCIDASWKKLVLFYKDTDHSPFYLAAIVLNPT